MMYISNDIMLISMINIKPRDAYRNLEVICEEVKR